MPELHPRLSNEFTYGINANFRLKIKRKENVVNADTNVAFRPEWCPIGLWMRPSSKKDSTKWSKKSRNKRKTIRKKLSFEGSFNGDSFVVFPTFLKPCKHFSCSDGHVKVPSNMLALLERSLRIRHKSSELPELNSSSNFFRQHRRVFGGCRSDHLGFGISDQHHGGAESSGWHGQHRPAGHGHSSPHEEHRKRLELHVSEYQLRSGFWNLAL